MQTLPMHVKTHAQALLGGMSGADGYCAAAQEFYQDVFGRGSFMGKGIYDPAALLAVSRTLPENAVLSHDLLEGELCHAQLCEDIACYDGHPARVNGFLRRAHRWTRGDWQLLPFLKDRRLDLLSRLKILDNLRRSLVPGSALDYPDSLRRAGRVAALYPGAAAAARARRAGRAAFAAHDGRHPAGCNPARAVAYARQP